MHRNNHHCEVRGVWSVTEHERFIEAIAAYPCGPWRLITEHVGTRSLKQVQTHAQKYQQKLMRQQRGLRKRKTKLKRPEHRVDETTLGQFTHTTIVRHAKRLVREQEEEAQPVESPSSFEGFNIAGVTTDDWALLTRDLSNDADLMELIPDIDTTKNKDDDDDEFPRFDDLYDPPKDWNAWQLQELLQPPVVNNTLDADKGGYLDGSELPVLEWTV